MRAGIVAVIAALLIIGGGGTVAYEVYAQNAETRANEKKYSAAIAAAEQRYGLPPNLLHSLLYQESHFRTDIIDGTTRSVTGAVGIAQFEPDTAAQFGIDPTDPYQAISAAAHYLANLHKEFGSWSAAVAAYNWGPGNVARRGLEAAPPSTQEYVAQITSDAGVLNG